MSTELDIRTVLRQAADAEQAPAIDQLGFDRRVRRQRRRRRVGLTAAVAAGAAVALLVPLAVENIDSDPGAASAPAAGGPNPPAYFAVGSQLMMLDKTGTVREVDFQTDGIVGPTANGVLLYGMDGRLARLRIEPNGDVEHLELPTTERLRQALVSEDGTQAVVASMSDLDLVVYDLASGRVVDRVPDIEDFPIYDFSDRLLYSDNGDLWLGAGEDAIRLPTPDGPASVGGDIVAVSGFDETTHLYDVSDGSPVQVRQVPGRTGEVSPDGRYYVAAVEEEGSPVQLWERATGDLRPFTGLTGESEQVRWLDADTALAVVGTLLFVCEASTLGCVEVYDAGTSDIQLGH
jgi:WD40 repeat protein